MTSLLARARRMGLGNLIMLSGAGFIILYSLTNPGNRSETDDGFGYAFRVETEPWRSLPLLRHFLYLPLMRLLYEGVRTVLATLRSYDVMVGASILFGVASVALIILICYRRLGMSLAASVLSGAGLGLSYGFWRYSVEAEVYALSGLAALIALWFALATPINLRSAIIASLAGALAFASNALNVTLVLMALPLYVLKSKGLGEAVRWFVLQSVACLIVLGGILLFHEGDGRSGGIPPFDVTIVELATSPINFGTNLISTNALNGLPAYLDLAGRAARGSVLDEERYVGQFIPPIITGLSIVSGLALALAGGRAIVLARRALRSGTIATVPKEAKLVCALWLGFYGLVVTAFGSGPEGWILALFPFWLLFGATVVDPLVKQGHLRWIGAGILLLGLHNLIGGILVMADPATDFNQIKAGWLIENADAQDYIVTSQGAVFARYVRFYSQAEVVYVEDDLTEDKIPGMLNGLQTRPGRIFFTDEVFRDPAYYKSQGRNVSALFSDLVGPLQASSQEVSSSAVGRVLELQRR